jgi:hypothetical protein
MVFGVKVLSNWVSEMIYVMYALQNYVSSSTRMQNWVCVLRKIGSHDAYVYGVNFAEWVL